MKRWGYLGSAAGIGHCKRGLPGGGVGLHAVGDCAKGPPLHTYSENAFAGSESVRFCPPCICPLFSSRPRPQLQLPQPGG